MHILSSIPIVASAPIHLNPCTTTKVRKEFRDLSISEWNDFKNALLSLQSNSSNGRTEWDNWTQMHVDNMFLAHGSDLFFPWHRAYVLALEQRLQLINPDIVIPYWDWTFDWERPLSSPIFSPDYGIDVLLSRDGDCRYRRQVFDPHCLIRDYNSSDFTTYYSPESVSAVISSEGNYSSFRELIEMVPHALVHTSLGGERGDMAFMDSPNDPIFFLHHSMIDYIWWIWQQVPSDRMALYGGNVDQKLEPFSVTVRDVLDINSLCYVYQPFSRNTAFVPTGTPIIGKTLHKRAVREARVWRVSSNWLQMNNITPKRLQQVINRFNRLAYHEGDYKR